MSRRIQERKQLHVCFESVEELIAQKNKLITVNQPEKWNRIKVKQLEKQKNKSELAFGHGVKEDFPLQVETANLRKICSKHKPAKGPDNRTEDSEGQI